MSYNIFENTSVEETFEEETFVEETFVEETFVETLSRIMELPVDNADIVGLSLMTSVDVKMILNFAEKYKLLIYVNSVKYGKDSSSVLTLDVTDSGIEVGGLALFH
jgi:hypothetical protein